MKKELKNILILIAITTYLYSCNAVKRVPKNTHLLDENTIIVNGKKNNTEALNELIFQKPNKKIAAIPLRLYLYNIARPNRDSLFEAWLQKKPKRKQRLKKRFSKKQVNKAKKTVLAFNNWLKKTGEAPVLVNEEKTKRSLKNLKNYYISNGWFDVKTNYSIERKDNKRATTTYTVETGKPFIIDSIIEIIESPIIDTLYQKIKIGTLIKQNEQYKTSNFKEERSRITKALRNSGVYHFDSDYISFEMDTIGTNKKVNVTLKIQNEAIKTPDSILRKPFKIFHISDVSIITDYSFENRNKPFLDSISYGGYKFYSYDKKIRYRPKALSDAIFISPGKVFRDIDRTRTQKYFNELRTFKYPSIEYQETSDRSLSNTIKLNPLKKFNVGFSTDVSQSNIQTIGLSLSPSLQIRNIFRGAETLELSGIGSIGSSKEVKIDTDPFFDIFEYGINLRLTIPRIFSSFYTENLIPNYMSPSTKVNLSTTNQRNIGLDKQTYSGNFSYNWFPNTKITNRLSLFNFQYVRNLNAANYFGVYTNAFNSLQNVALNTYNTPAEFITTDGNGNEIIIRERAVDLINNVLSNPIFRASNPEEYKTVSAINERRERLTENNLILSSSFNFTNDERTNLFDHDFSIFRFNLELAGNLLAGASELLGLEKNSENRYEIFNVSYSQFLRTELDYIKHWDLGHDNVLAIRSFFGIAIPFGNSNSIPFSKSFFGGGPNDNRAWSAYDLGPGSSNSFNEFNEANFKLALSIEQRFNFFKNFNGAVFIDSGNIWNVLDNIEDEEATFSSLNSLKNIAVGSGFGLRYDFSYFVFRLDIGFKTYNPAYKNEKRWFNDYNFSNAVYNIGINYPF